MVRKKRMKKITLNEFKAWLEGVEELQPEDWCPDVNQWALIREKIKSIVQEKPVAPVVPMQDTQYMNPRQYGPILNQPAPAPVNLPAGITPAPEVGGIPPAPVDMSPAAQQMLNSNGQQATKTPDIDTSDGNVTSSFA